MARKRHAPTLSMIESVLKKHMDKINIDALERRSRWVVATQSKISPWLSMIESPMMKPKVRINSKHLTMTPVKIEPPTDEPKPTAISKDIMTPIKVDPVRVESPMEKPKPETSNMEILTPIKDKSLGEKTEQVAGGCVYRYRGCCCCRGGCY